MRSSVQTLDWQCAYNDSAHRETSNWIVIFFLFPNVASYCVVQLRGLRLLSHTRLNDGARPGAAGRPPRPRQELHGGRRPPPSSAQRAHLAIVAVEIPLEGGPPQVQHHRGWPRAKAHRGLLCARVGHGWARLSHAAACLAGNLLTQLGLAETLSAFGPA